MTFFNRNWLSANMKYHRGLVGRKAGSFTLTAETASPFAFVSPGIVREKTVTSRKKNKRKFDNEPETRPRVLRRGHQMKLSLE